MKRHRGRTIQVTRFKVSMINRLIAGGIFFAVICSDCLNCVCITGFHILGGYLESKCFACTFMCEDERRVFRGCLPSVGKFERKRSF